MRTETADKLNRVREKALARGVPAAEVERWLAAARPCAVLSSGADGPVVGRFGGPALLPGDAPGIPERQRLIADLDLAALPGDATGLPLPSSGRLLLFARFHAYDLDASGTAVYVPAGIPVEERHPADHRHEPDHGWEGVDLATGEELRLGYDVSLPDNEVLIDPAGHPHAGELRAAWSDVRYEDWGRLGGTRLQIGGYSTDPFGEDDPVTASALRASGDPEGRRASPWARPRPEDWALLAQWNGLIGGFVYWTAARKDLAERRFDRAAVLACFDIH
ncbi:DUF1963 domain-containing protein [Streptomyces nitrosporeus]|uniref:DUF1963 domain-containing protein n=1 Tax=Streptomyces nitrosporeus TaxID=28894 RepID=A0A5J6FED9_9ACTN|nr:DUF1963 domain-containing protein [Streptomyces nitrosporeus]QEU73874.1 DUF1963 domain-containing protein [Streptomyces nitrosporeus]GGZ25949.1 hypothetical protein GCM10010327_65750 [Streptomyces nitrosporeus]